VAAYQGEKQTKKVENKPKKYETQLQRNNDV